ncbi:hypothetical protein AB0D49_40935 [Streptomyces sp. NPDC048290]|uniref:hypothetical protein n=1 Tax=Streptomyces sp. NPDC048290 TaxID=3155811 RepID=UPI00342F19E7
MRRSPRSVFLAVAAGAVVLGGAPPAAAEPATEVSPARARPGGTVTVSVTCDPVGGTAPRTMDATSRAFAERTVALRLEPGGGQDRGAPRYRGTARIATGAHFEDGGARAGSGGGHGDGGGAGSGSGGGHGDGGGAGSGAGGGIGDVGAQGAVWMVGGGGAGSGAGGGHGDVGAQGAAWTVDGGGSGSGVGGGHGDGGARDAAWTVDGECPAARGGKGKAWSATFTVQRDTSGGIGGGIGGGDGGVTGGGHGGGHGGGDGGGDGGVHRPCPPGQDHMSREEPWSREEPGSDRAPGDPGTGSDDRRPGESRDCAPPPRTEHGVHAGSGGTFTDSVPALVAGGLLIAGACTGAAYRLRHRLTRAQG